MSEVFLVMSEVFLAMSEVFLVMSEVFLAMSEVFLAMLDFLLLCLGCFWPCLRCFFTNPFWQVIHCSIGFARSWIGWIMDQAPRRAPARIAQIMDQYQHRQNLKLCSSNRCSRENIVNI